MSEGIGVRLVALATLALLSAGAHAQEVPLKCEPRASGEQLTQRPSPYDSASVRVGNMEAKICYSRPIARDRVIFGGLVLRTTCSGERVPTKPRPSTFPSLLRLPELPSSLVNTRSILCQVRESG